LRFRYGIAVLLMTALGTASAQSAAMKTSSGVEGKQARKASSAKDRTNASTPGKNTGSGTAKNTGKTAKPVVTTREAEKKKFVLDVVRTAVALPQADMQDRLRVLASAASVVKSLDRQMGKRLAKEGARIESDLIARGETPVVSMLASGHFECDSASEFIQSIPVESVNQAEQSLLGIVVMCRKAQEPARQKLEAALEQRVLAPRALLAVMEQRGLKSPWSQDTFVRMFSSLPADAERWRNEAPNFAAMYMRIAPEVDQDTARDAGLKFLEWLGKLEPGNERNLSVNLATAAMKQALGEEGFSRALESNVMARQIADTAGQQAEFNQPTYESVSVLSALDNRGRDRTQEISELGPSLRAREAAAHGFASGTGGERDTAERYFDIAFSAANEVWSKRAEQQDAPAVIEEISEAAAQVDAISALKRAQALSDPSAQAIGMIAVARVVMGRQDEPPQKEDPNAPKPKHPLK